MNTKWTIYKNQRIGVGKGAYCGWMWELFVGRGVTYGEIARMPLKLMARQIAELRRDERTHTGEPDGLGRSYDIAKSVRSYAQSQERGDE